PDRQRHSALRRASRRYPATPPRCSCLRGRHDKRDLRPRPRPLTRLGPTEVARTGNTPRVRDGYISLSTRGHTRARPTRREGAICRRNVIASARPCSPVPPLKGSTVRVRQRASASRSPCRSAPFVCERDDGPEARRPPSVHHSPRLPPARPGIVVAERLCAPPFRGPPSVHGPLNRERVEERNGVFAAVAGEITVVAVDHRDARAHEAGDREYRHAGAEREGSVRV